MLGLRGVENLQLQCLRSHPYITLLHNFLKKVMNKPYFTQLTINSRNINSHFYCDSKYNHTKTPEYVTKRQRI